MLHTLPKSEAKPKGARGYDKISSKKKRGKMQKCINCDKREGETKCPYMDGVRFTQAGLWVKLKTGAKPFECELYEAKNEDNI